MYIFYNYLCGYIIAFLEDKCMNNRIIANYFRALMIQYTPAKELILKGFEHPFDLALDAQYRWVKLVAFNRLR